MKMKLQKKLNTENLENLKDLDEEDFYAENQETNRHKTCNFC